MDGLGQRLLLGREACRQEKLCHPEHAIHGSTDFVAHVRQELTLRDGRGFRAFFGMAELGLRAFSVRDIPDESTEGDA